MRKLGCVLAVLLMAPLIRCAAAEEQPLKVHGYLMWSREYLFVAAHVDDPMLIGVNQEAMSAPWEDDAVEVDLDLGAEPGQFPGPKSYRIVTSVAEGFSIDRGTGSGRWQPDARWLEIDPRPGSANFRMGVQLDGTLNNPADTDRGWTVELALPWRLLGGSPTRETRIAFNLANWVRGEADTLASWSSQVTSEADLSVPRKWGMLALVPAGTPSVAGKDIATCPLARAMPVMDGRLNAAEWIAASTLEFERPRGTVGASTQLPASKFSRLVLATYYYCLDARGPDAHPEQWADQPMDGVGPWLSYDRVDWHTQQLREALRADLDVILPVYRGDAQSRHTWARRGLSRLVQALKELRAQGIAPPLLGMCLDVSSLGAAADLTQPATQASLYAMIREFFQYVPPDLRLEAGLSAQPGERHPQLVVIGRPSDVGNWDGGFVGFCNQAFERDFPDYRLVWLGDPEWRTRGAAFDGYCALETRAGGHYDSSGEVRVLSLSPGYRQGREIAPRLGGEGYRRDWQKAVALRPDHVAVESWNDYLHGTEVAPSRQYGATYVTVTARFAEELSARSGISLGVRRETIPRVMLPGTTYDVPLLVKNYGAQDLAAADRVEIEYHLVSRANRMLQAAGPAIKGFSLSAGQTGELRLTVTTNDSKGQRLPTGDYTLSFRISQSRLPLFRSPWLRRQLAAISLPVRIGTPVPYRLTVLSTTSPTALLSGASAKTVLTVRNDGSRAWKASSIKLGCRWHRAGLADSGTDEQAVELLDPEGLRFALPRDVKPGQVVKVSAAVVASAAGRPLDPWTPEQDWHYQLSWCLVEGPERWLSSGGRSYDEVVEVTARDAAAVFVDCSLPSLLEAGKSYPCQLVMRNAGSAAWSPGSTAVGYRWFSPDGRLVPDGEAQSALEKELPAGGKLVLPIEVKVPAIPGPYRIVWDLWQENHGWCDQDSGLRGGDLLVRSVAVAGGPYLAVDIGGALNVAAATSDNRRSAGNFDGQGNSFPLEELPRDAFSPASEMYRAGYYAPESKALGPPFAFPRMEGGQWQAARCEGQTIALPRGAIAALHVLGAATSADASGELVLQRADGTSKALPLRMSAWTGSPTSGEQVAFAANHMHRTSRDDGEQTCRLFAYTLPIEPGELSTLQLPQQPGLKIVAITAELKQ